MKYNEVDYTHCPVCNELMPRATVERHIQGIKKFSEEHRLYRLNHPTKYGIRIRKQNARRNKKTN